MRKLILLITILLVSSCAVMRNESHLDIIDGTIFQVLDSNDALVLTKDYQVVKIITTDEVYFDGRSIVGLFVLVDTYHYVTKAGIYKVVPVYVRYTEYRRYSSY